MGERASSLGMTPQELEALSQQQPDLISQAGLEKLLELGGGEPETARGIAQLVINGVIQIALGETTGSRLESSPRMSRNDAAGSWEISRS